MTPHTPGDWNGARCAPSQKQTADASRRTHGRPPVSEARRRARLLALPVLLALMTGCGNALSGGSIPSGKTRVKGKVVPAERPIGSGVHARIQITSTAAGQEPTTYTATTDDRGAFDIQDIKTGETAGNVQMSITPDDPALRANQLSFGVTNRGVVNMLATVPTRSFDVSRGVTIVLDPPNLTLHPGETVRFQAKVLDAAGATLPVTPSLVLNGDFGTPGPDGTFTGTGQGSGFVTAYWYGTPPARGQIVVDEKSSTNPKPPPPPVFP